jgi:hypothetical protein
MNKDKLLTLAEDWNDTVIVISKSDMHKLIDNVDYINGVIAGYQNCIRDLLRVINGTYEFDVE